MTPKYKITGLTPFGGEESATASGDEEALIVIARIAQSLMADWMAFTIEVEPVEEEQ